MWVGVGYGGFIDGGGKRGGVVGCVICCFWRWDGGIDGERILFFVFVFFGRSQSFEREGGKKSFHQATFFALEIQNDKDIFFVNLCARFPYLTDPSRKLLRPSIATR